MQWKPVVSIIYWRWFERAKPRKGQNQHYKMVKIKPCNQHAFSCTKDTLEVVVYQSEKILEFHSGIPEIHWPKFHKMSEFPSN